MKVQGSRFSPAAGRWGAQYER